MIVRLEVAALTSDMEPTIIVESKSIQLFVIYVVDDLYKAAEVAKKELFEFLNDWVLPIQHIEVTFEHAMVLSLGRVGFSKLFYLTRQNEVP